MHAQLRGRRERLTGPATSLLIAAALAALSLASANPFALAAQSSATTTCKVVPFAPDSNFNGDHVMHDIDALATNDIWAVGEDDADDGTGKALAYHYDGHKWKSSSLAPLQSGWPYQILYSVAARAKNDVWAFGQETNAAFTHVQLFIEHWNGQHWTFNSSFVIPGADAGGYLDVPGGVAISASDAWVVGDTIGAVFALHWDGSAWSSTTLPAGLQYMTDVTGSAAHGVWAAGGSFPNQSIVTWNGSEWQTAQGFNTVRGSINGLDITKAGRVVGVGSADDMSKRFAVAGPTPSWVTQAVPATQYDYTALNDVTVVSAKNIWAVGVTRRDQFIGVHYPVIYRWNGTKWSRLSTPIDRHAGETLVSVTNVPGSNQVYAAGYVDHGSQVPKDLLITRIC